MNSPARPNSPGIAPTKEYGRFHTESEFAGEDRWMEGQTRGQGEGAGRNVAGLLKLGIKDGGGLGDSED